MLESGVDRIITQVVDPKLNHIFRPHIENAIHDFLATEKKEEGASNSAPDTEQQETTSNTAAKTQWGTVHLCILHFIRNVEIRCLLSSHIVLESNKK